MLLGKLHWSIRSETGSVRISVDFNDQDILLQLDALNDWIEELERLKEKKEWEFLLYLKKVKDDIDADRTRLPSGGPVSEPSQGQALGNPSRIQDPVPGKLRLVGQAPDPGVAGS
jgi:hypothetical protein